MPLQHDLIFDLGANRGEDTEFYLAKGFRVLAVEANPLLCRELRQRLAGPLAEGRLVLLNLGLWSEAGAATFYVNEDNDHWSSFDPAYGTRQGSRFRTVEVPCVPLWTLLLEHGLPHYLKIDIEGADRLVLEQLRAWDRPPPFISVEEYGVQALHDLRAAGYSGFQLFPQADKGWAVPPDPAREGRHAARVSTGRDSGLFGRELPDEWLDFATAFARYTTGIRDPSGRWLGPAGEWFDIHARL